MDSHGNTPKRADAGNLWPDAFDILLRETRRLVVPIVALALVFALVGVALRMAMPQTHRATAELLIDPRGLRVFQNELVTGQYDANAAVNFVESQIHVILSTRVLSQALLYVEAERSGGQAGSAQIERTVSPAEIEALRRRISVSRAERSYILSVTARSADPQEAASLANAVLKAYLDEDAASRAGVAQRLTEDLGSRLSQLRQRLAESEQRAEDFRRRNNLVSTDDRLIVDQQLAAAVSALGASEERLSAMQVRHVQLLSADANAVTALAGSAEQARLSALISRQTSAREEMARLSTRLGARHPALRTAQSQMEEVDRLMAGELSRIRSSSETALRQAQKERDSLAATVEGLTQQNAAARGSSIELRTLEQEVESDRALLSSFENRTREMAEFARIDSANVRMLSTAYPPQVGRGTVGKIMWGFAGAVFGVMLGLAYAVLRTIMALMPASVKAPRARPAQPEAPLGRKAPTNDRPNPVRPDPVRPNRAPQGLLAGLPRLDGEQPYRARDRFPSHR